MRAGSFAFLLCCTIVPTAFAADAIHCSIQSAPAVTDADPAVIAGDWAKAEILFTAQLKSKALPVNFSGVVRSQIAQNKLAEALTTAQRAVAETPTSAAAQALLGDVLFRSGNIPEAASHRATAARKLVAAHTLAPERCRYTLAGTG